MTETMKAFVLTRYGGPEGTEMRDVARPVAGSGEVLIRVEAAGLNPVDFKTRDGQLKPILRYDPPAIMGNELAGVVETVGAGVTGFAPGDRVFARTPKEAMGALARYAAVPADCVAKMPPGLSFEEAAGVPLAGLTALQALRDELGVGPGSRVLITGGAGGVGTLAIQIAKWLGADVVTTASPRGRDLVIRLGADRVIDYTSQKFEEHLYGLDGVFDLIGAETLRRAFRVVKPGGTVVSIAGMPEPETARKDLGGKPLLAAMFWAASFGLRRAAARQKVRYRYLFMHPSGKELAELAAAIADGRLEPVIDRIFPFEKVAEAFSYLEEGHAKGKVVVTMGAAH